MNTLLTILYTVIIFGVIITIHEFGHFIFAKLGKITVHEFSIGMGPKIISKQKNETLYALRLFPIGGYVSMEGEDEESDDEGAFNKKSVKTRFSVLAAGAILNIILGLVLLIFINICNDKIVSNTVGGFVGEKQSQKSGLEIGDNILSVNNKRTFIANDIIYAISRDKDGVVDMKVKRGNEKLDIKNIKFNILKDENGISYPDIDFRVNAIDSNIFDAIKYSFFEAFSMISMVISSFGDLITGAVSFKQLSGPIGVATVIGDAAKTSILSLLNLAAFLTINIGVFNLLPLPALDGGRLVFLAIEGVRGKPIQPKYEGYVHMIGLALLLALMLLVTFQDIFKLFN